MSNTSTNLSEEIFIYRYGVSVDVKVEDYVRRVFAEDLGLCEKFFIDRRDQADSPAIREESELCRAVLKWAGTCGGFLVEANNYQKNREHFLTLRFEFEHQNSFNDFSNELISCVQSATGYSEIFVEDRVSIKGYDAYVDVKMAQWVRGVPTDNLWAAERHFVTQRDHARTWQEKRMYDTCRATVKWASTCGAVLLRVCNHVIIAKEGSYLRFDLRFSSKDYFDEFEKYLVPNVEGAVV